jgi:uncharacterized iron-regulated membrane protein
MSSTTSAREGHFYNLVWRWHFYAGLYVTPFLILLPLTGLVILWGASIDAWLYRDRLFVSPAGTLAGHQNRLEAVRQAYPLATLTHYKPLPEADRTTEVLIDQQGVVRAVYVDPYSARVVGDIEDSSRPSVVAHLIHGTLLIGTLGDRLVELAAGLGIVLLITGVYLWWPRGTSVVGAFRLGAQSSRGLARSMHVMVGVVLAPALLFHLISGLAWSGIWGERYVQAWNTYPAEKFAPATTGEHVHEEMNPEGRKLVPWGLEATPMPASNPAGHAHGAPGVTLDDAIRIARAEGIGARYMVTVPRDEQGVWTVASTAMAGDLTDPRDELTVHVDRFTGQVLGRVTWDDYSLGARAMTVGVPLHQGSFGPWNRAATTLVALLIAMLPITGICMWWLRRPSRVWRLAAPPRPANARAPLVALVTAVLVGIAFPVVGVTFVLVATFDYLIVQRVPAVRSALS